MNPLEIVEHEMFDKFFMACVAEVVAERNKASRDGALRLKRSGYDALLDLDLIHNKEKRKEAIYACAQKRGSLSRRERDFLEYLTVRAGAKVVAWVNSQTTPPEKEDI